MPAGGGGRGGGGRGGGRGIRTHDGFYPIAVFKPDIGAPRPNADQLFPQVRAGVVQTAGYPQEPLRARATGTQRARPLVSGRQNAARFSWRPAGTTHCVGRGHAAAHDGDPHPGRRCPAVGATPAPTVAVRRVTPLPRQRLPGPEHQGTSDSVPFLTEPASPTCPQAAHLRTPRPPLVTAQASRWQLAFPVLVVTAAPASHNGCGTLCHVAACRPRRVPGRVSCNNP